MMQAPVLEVTWSNKENLGLEVVVLIRSAFKPCLPQRRPSGRDKASLHSAFSTVTTVLHCMADITRGILKV